MDHAWCSCGSTATWITWLRCGIAIERLPAPAIHRVRWARKKGAIL
ncbi:hypothetical protein OH686_04630 [Pseudomonas sp. SO81]|nr:hypothetical protein OH686_04630 [Pseudomonas sp. SO81]